MLTVFTILIVSSLALYQGNAVGCNLILAIIDQAIGLMEKWFIYEKFPLYKGLNALHLASKVDVQGVNKGMNKWVLKFISCVRQLQGAVLPSSSSFKLPNEIQFWTAEFNFEVSSALWRGWTGCPPELPFKPKAFYDSFVTSHHIMLFFLHII